jgi:hypothetical protein
MTQRQLARLEKFQGADAVLRLHERKPPHDLTSAACFFPFMRRRCKTNKKSRWNHWADEQMNQRLLLSSFHPPALGRGRGLENLYRTWYLEKGISSRVASFNLGWITPFLKILPEPHMRYF